MFGTQVVMPENQDGIKDLCYMLWTKCFDDTKEYTDYYFDNRWNKSITVLSDNVSMLNLNPYDTLINGKKTEICYIAGVCTLKEYRKRGHMDAVLKEALGLMYGMGKPFVYLMPASEEIYKPYGFTGIYPVKGWDGKIPPEKNIEPKSICIPYNMLNNKQKAQLIKYAGRKLAERFTCYTVHNESYFQNIYEEMLVCNGNILVFWNFNKDTCLGYVVYLCEETPEIAESVFEMEIQEDIFAYMQGLGFKEVKIYETNFWKLDYAGMEGHKDYLMARIVDLKAFAGCISSKEREEMWLDISDSLVSGNNGRWHIITGEGETYCQKCDGEAEDNVSGIKYTKCTIEEFGQKYLGRIKYFLNEFV